MTYTVMPAAAPWRSWLPEDDEDGPFPMTLIGSLHCGDSILVGADTAATDTRDNRVYAETAKLGVLPRWDPPLVWAYAGDGTIASEFQDWIERREPTPRW